MVKVFAYYFSYSVSENCFGKMVDINLGNSPSTPLQENYISINGGEKNLVSFLLHEKNLFQEQKVSSFHAFVVQLNWLVENAFKLDSKHFILLTDSELRDTELDSVSGRNFMPVGEEEPEAYFDWQLINFFGFVDQGVSFDSVFSLGVFVSVVLIKI